MTASLWENAKRRAMFFSKSMTFDDEEIRRAVVPVPMIAARGIDDPVFIEKLKAGDETAFETLIDRYSGDIYALLYRLTENPEEASDLTQDTFLRAVRSIKTFRGESELKTWLFRIAINESRNRFRWWKRRKRDLTISLDATIGESETRISDTLADHSISPEERALSHEREAAISTALLEIQEVYREAIVLCDVEGLSYEETAAALGIGIGTVKSRISRGREELRRRLKDF
ncbi:MAG TPA: sigma-70 family RNA polymerase sigma factor [Pyrinomonadaceae bacterium]|nr:sigma-70 family RNA polymerase sigma factor [Pyrinomonadaceae bacterium]